MSSLRDQANAEAQSALHAMNEYRIRHNGAKCTPLDAAYEAAERMVEAIEEYENALALAHEGAEDAVYVPGPFYLPDVPLAAPDFVALVEYLDDPGDHFAGREGWPEFNGAFR